MPLKWKSAFALSDFHKLFKLIRSSSNARYRQPDYPEQWVEQFASQFNLLASSVPRMTWDVSTEPLNQTEVLRELQHLERYTTPGLDNLSAASFKDGGPALVTESTSIFVDLA